MQGQDMVNIVVCLQNLKDMAADMTMTINNIEEELNKVEITDMPAPEKELV